MAWIMVSDNVIGPGGGIGITDKINTVVAHAVSAYLGEDEE